MERHDDVPDDDAGKLAPVGLRLRARRRFHTAPHAISRARVVCSDKALHGFVAAHVPVFRDQPFVQRAAVQARAWRRRRHPDRDRLGPGRGGKRLAGPAIDGATGLARQPVADRMLVHAKLARDRPVTQAALVQHLDRHHFLPSQPAPHARPPPRGSDRSTSKEGAQKFVSS